MRLSARSWPVRAGIVIGVGLVTLGCASAALAKTTITGAGATAPQLLYSQWAKNYGAAQINYQGVGSGAGINAIEAGTVNFGASDKPLLRSGGTPPTLDGSPALVQFPSCIEGIVPIVNISGVTGQLKLTAQVLAQIYMGQITKWNDAAIKALNPGLNLPAKTIVVWHRSDSSGTTFIFTKYLQIAAKSVWPQTPAYQGMTVPWKTGVGAKGSSGVAQKVMTTANSIGYVEYTWAVTDHIRWAELKNASGAWVKPSASAFAAAGSHASYSWSNGFVTNLENMKGTTVWPITGETYILVRRAQSNYATAHAMLSFFNWAYKSSTGVSDAKKLTFVPLPSKAITAIEKTWHSLIKAGSKPCW
jgi:phosphate transport system substrate-binding protein